MKVVFLLFDSLNRHALSCYGNKQHLTPNFDRLAERSVQFERHFVGSLPCMPARRDIQTGRLNFLHRGWGPLEPFDHSVADILRSAGVITHLITDHYHYFEDGGAGFHGRYSSWEFIRGQEKDKWQPQFLENEALYKNKYEKNQYDFSTDINSKLPYFINREYLEKNQQFPLAQCFDQGIDFLKKNGNKDQWLLHLELFDPHEPFFAPERFLKNYPEALSGKIFDWPSYGRTDISPSLLNKLRANYSALIDACDHYLGLFLDEMDQQNLWEDTWVILTTDHGLLLGEKEFLGKNRPPFYNEVAHIPLFIAPPNSFNCSPQKSKVLTQTIDIMPTILDIFKQNIPEQVTGYSLLPLMQKNSEKKSRDGCIFGQFGSAINFTDGRYSYFMYPLDPQVGDLYQYTLMPSHMRTFFEVADFKDAQIIKSLPFSQGFPVWRLPVNPDTKANMVKRYPLLDAKTVLFDLDEDPDQRKPLNDLDLEISIRKKIIRLMMENDAPEELFSLYGLELDKN